MLTRQISVSEQTVKRLKALAEPLDDTYDSLISRLLDAYGDRSSERGKNTAAPASMPSESGSRARLRRYAERSGDTHVLNILGVGEPRERRFDPLVPPNLTHTKITSASFDGRPLIPASWNGLWMKVSGRRRGSSGSMRKFARYVT